MIMKHQKLLRLSILTLGLACAFPAGSQQQGSQGGSQSAAGGQSADTNQREGTDWGWIGLLGLIGLAGLRRREDRTYGDKRHAT
jgi:MYXO-CTERM domain-containing protein